MSGPVRSPSRLAFGVGLAAAALACAGPPPPPGGLLVEVLAGDVRPPPVDGSRPRPLVIVLDATHSMAAADRERPSPFAAAREAARAIAAAAGEDAPLEVLLLGGDGAGTCGPARWLDGPNALGDLQPGGEASLAVALGGLARRVPSGPGDPAPRVIVLSDLRGECGGDTCAAAARLVDAGAELTVLALGDDPPPQCLGAVDVDRSRSLDWAIPPDRSGTPFVALDVSSGVVLGRGAVGGPPVRLPPRAVLLRLDLDPALRLGPVLVEPGLLTRVRILDFPRAEPPVREWLASVEGPLPPTPTEPGMTRDE